MAETAVPTDRSTLRAQGISQSQIDRALHRGDLVATQRGVLVPGRALSAYDVRCRAALTTQRDDAVVWRRSAAVLHGLPYIPPEWRAETATIEVAAQRDDVSRGSRRGMQRRICRLDETDVTVIDGMRVTTAPRTLADLARDHSRQFIVALMDAAVQAGHCSVDELHAVLPRLFGLRGVVMARNAVHAVRLGVDSPGETRARLAIADAGLPEPDLRIELWDDGVLAARGDLGYRRWLFWMEYDGFAVHAEQRVFRSDRHRDRWLTRRGWEVMRLCDADVSEPSRFTHHLDQSLAAAPARIAALAHGLSPEADAARAALLTAPLPR
jgi:hypothetical protein